MFGFPKEVNVATYVNENIGECLEVDNTTGAVKIEYWFTMHRLYRLMANNKLVVASYDKKQLFDFARRNRIKGTLIKQYEPAWIIRQIRERDKLLFSNNEQQIDIL